MSDRLAVIVGCNYAGTPYELSGCHNDALDWQITLASRGYDTRVLLDPARGDLLATLAAAVRRIGWGDRLVFTFSGHGTWQPDRDGDEADRRDEAMVAGDMGLVTDDELNVIMGQLAAGAGGLILSDSCHSGTVSRFAGADPDQAVSRRRELEGPPKPRFLSPAVFNAGMTERQALELESTLDRSAPRRTVNLISGCADPEYSYDAWFQQPSGEWRANGAFTRAAVDTYQAGRSLAGWFKAIRGQLPSDDYPQSPQLTSSSLYRRYARAL